MKKQETKKQICTAENFIVNKFKELDSSQVPPTPKIVEEWLIEFAKYHVELALNETSERFKNPENVRYIKNHYSLDKIQ